MQQSPLALTGPSWKDVGEVAGALFAGLAFLFKWVIVPAARTANREDLKPELEQVRKIPVIENRLDNLEKIAESMAGVPESLARIEGYVAGKKE